MRGSAHLFGHLAPDLLLDIGARNGESIVKFRRIWPLVEIISFEPRSVALKVLRKTASEAGRVTVHPFALGTEEGRFSMFEFPEDDGGSSILAPTETLKGTRAWANKHRKVIVQMKRLDDFEIEGEPFIKIDVQGFQNDVVKGGPDTFSRAIGCLIEVGSEPLYEGQGEFGEVDEMLTAAGLTYAGESRRVMRGNVFSWADQVWLR